MSQRGKCSFMLVLTALIWGSAFVAQSVGMDYIGPFTFNSVRSILGGLALLPVIWVRGRKKVSTEMKAEGKQIEAAYGITAEEGQAEYTSAQREKTLLLGGLCCGLALAAASSLQQIGIMYTTAGKSGFITALYILIVPIFGLFMGKKVNVKIWAGVALAVAGMYFLCMKEGLSISKGDFLVFLCAIVFSIHILVIDYFSPKVDGVKLSCIQFFVSGIVCAFPMALLEKPAVSEILTAYAPILYAGVLSSGVGYTLQVVAQKNTDPTVASLIMSLESVFAALTGWLALHERLSGRELFGCVLVFAAIILAQLPDSRVKGKEDFRRI